MGSAYMRYSSQRWYIRYKGSDGKWTQAATDFHGPEQEHLARKLLALVESRVAAQLEAGTASGPLTVRLYAKTWIERRRGLNLSDVDNDEARLDNHVLPVIGDMLIGDVRPRHIARVIDKVRAKGRAPKTVRNIYNATRALFHEAQFNEIIIASPCILDRHHLGEITDAVHGWRPTAKLERDELELVISDERIEWDRRVMYALEGLGALRHGEAAGMRWGDYEAQLRPLGRIVVARSYNKAPKTKRAREMPVHPTLSAILAEWKLEGWPEMMGRQPTPDDLIVPTPKGLRTKLGSMRTKNYSRRRWETDLVHLGLRHRRPHDLRRTFVSLARMDGARMDVLERCTHTPSRARAIEDYTTFDWATKCAEVAKLRVQRRHPEQAACFALASSDAVCGNLLGEDGGGAGNRSQVGGEFSDPSTSSDVGLHGKSSGDGSVDVDDVSLGVRGDGPTRSKRSKRSAKLILVDSLDPTDLELFAAWTPWGHILPQLVGDPPDMSEQLRAAEGWA